MNKLIKVLFVSPKDPEKPGKLKFLMGGENTFTRTLLANPPPKMEYTHHQQALKESKIKYTSHQRLLSFLMKARILPPDVGMYSFEIRQKFDLIHTHAHSLKLKNYSGPVVLSDSSSNYLFLRDYLGWSKTRIDLSYKLREMVSKSFDIYDPNLNLYKAKKLIVWSNFAKKVHRDLGCDPKKIAVVPPGIDKPPVKKAKHDGFNIIFVGIWFKRKGGPLVLEAYKALKKKYPEIKLTLIGQVPEGEKLPKDAWHKDYLPREKLIKEIFPQADVLVLVPPVAEGYGLVVHEAASLGIPPIVSRVYALPEIVRDQDTGFVIPPSDLDALVNRLEKLIKNRALREKMGHAAQKRFLKEFWIEQTNKKLLKVYQEAIGR